MPVYIGLHTIALALYLPFVVFFEACASMLFGFLPDVFCVFMAKILGASLSFWIGRVFTIHGSTDEVIHVEDAHEFAKIIPNHKLHVIEGANH